MYGRRTLARCAALFLIATACGSAPDRPASDAPSSTDAPAAGDAPASDAPPPVDAQPDAPAPVDAFPAVLDLHINCRNDCVLVADPASIAVPAGTMFEVNWINTGDTECDVAKIDQFNQVPIIIGLQPGTSYHDDVRQWCGMFTGTFDFRVTICTIHSFIPVDCSAP
jgi:hypothetical protein